MNSCPPALIQDPRYHSPEIFRFVKHYYLGKTLYRGRFTDVALGKHRASQQKVIIKSIQTKHYCKLKEASFLKKLIHVPGVIKYFDHFNITHNVNLLVIEYFSKMSLKTLLHQYGPLSEINTHTIFKQLVSTVQSCFSCFILHRDIKPSNILININTLQIKLINFNSASHFNTENDQFNTPLSKDIAPPEYFTRRSYSPNGLYVWALGLILYEMLYNRPPCQTNNNVVRYFCSLYAKKPLSVEAEQLVFWMLTKKTKKRILLHELEHHPWITKKWI